MKTPVSFPRRAPPPAFTLIEVLVYIGILFILLGLGYAALYQGMDNSTALRRSAADIANALHAGEGWRADVRAARAPLRLETNAAGCVLRLAEHRGTVEYRFATNAVFRRQNGDPWIRVLGHVKTTAFLRERQFDVTAWRWELEMQTTHKRLGGIRPLFTFIAVPEGENRPDGQAMKRTEVSE